MSTQSHLATRPAGRRFSRILGILLAVLVFGTIAAPSGAQDLPGVTPTPDPADALFGGDTLQMQVDAYKAAYPGITDQQARVAAQSQEERKELYTKVSALGFGGAHYDPITNVLHLNFTDEQSADQAEDQAQEDAATFRVETHLVDHSFAHLSAVAEELRSGDSDLSRAADGQIGIDVRANRVEVALSEEEVARFSETELPAEVVLVVDPELETEADYACTSRSNCDVSLRAGNVLWRSGSGNVCSLGFTAKDQYNRRYALTAGHCSNGNGVTWGTGASSIGPMYASIDSGAYDAAIIRNFNGYYSSTNRGEIYMNTGWVRVNSAAPTVSYIWEGDTVCLAANYTDPGASGNRCGVVKTNSDSAVRGMAKVDGLDACGGDSGGGWYWLASSSNRVAFGLHSRSSSGCNGSAGGNSSWFTPVPLVTENWAPWLDIELS